MSVQESNGVRFPDVTVELLGQDGNAFMIMGLVQKALRRAGHGKEVAAYIEEATSGDYDHLLSTTMDWVNVE